MNFRKLIFVALLFSAAVSCKDDDEGTVKPSLDGTLSIAGLQEYVIPGQTLELSPEGLTHPDGEALTYYWKVSPTAPTACTTEVFSITFTDTLQTCTIYCNATAEGYSASSTSSLVTVVKGGKDGSIKGIEFPDDNFSTDDATYYYTQIGTQTWILNNVAERSSGKPYRNADAMSDVIGRYYSYSEAVAVCESLSTDDMKWALPTLEDWQTLQSYIKGEIGADPQKGKSTAAALMGDATFNDQTMWEYWPAVGDITNSSGFGAISAGYTNLETRSFEGVYEYATFWTATADEQGDLAYCAYIICDEPDLYITQKDTGSFGASVRCIRK